MNLPRTTPRGTHSHLGAFGTTRSLALVMVYVDAHHARAVAAGAASISEPETKFYGDRSYQAKDPEGHTWYFAQHVRDVSPEEMEAQAK